LKVVIEDYAFSGFSNKQVEAKYGISHHYRICEFGGFKCLENTSVIDKNPLR